MSAALQIVLGSGLLMLCSALHISLLIAAVWVMRAAGTRFSKPHRLNHWGAFTAVAFAAVVAAHTIQVWLWATTLYGLSALPSFSDALYFALVTYTTLGYGDVTVAEEFRLFGAMASVTGLLNFGLSTAFLVGLMAKLLPIKLND